MLREAIVYPTRGDDADESLVTVAILALAAGLLARSGVFAVLAVAPVALLVGYLGRVLAASADGADALPAFADLRGLAREGAVGLAVAAAYLGVPAALLAVTYAGAVGRTGATADLGNAVTVFGGATVTLAVCVGFAYLFPAALTRAAVEGRLRAAFDRSLGGVARDAAYFTGWVVAVLAVALGHAVAGVAAAVPVVGPLVAVAVSLYATLVAGGAAGRAYGRAKNGRGRA